jgi:hypothetical protein
MWAHYLREPQGLGHSDAAAPPAKPLPAQRRGSRGPRDTHPELRDVIDAFSKRRLFEETTPASFEDTRNASLAKPPPEAPRRPPVVEWLLLSSETSAPFATVGEADVDADGELINLLEALDAGSPIQTHSVDAVHAPDELCPSRGSGIPNNIHDNDDGTVGTPRRSESNSLLRDKMVEGMPLTTGSFALLGVCPPRTGSGESMDEMHHDALLSAFDMDAVRRALQAPQALESRPPSPIHKLPGLASGDTPRKHSQQRILRGRGGIAPSPPPRLVDEDLDVLQRGFHDLTKRRTACDVSAVKARLYEQPHARPRRGLH